MAEIDFLALLKEARAAGTPERVLQAIPYARFLDLRLEASDDPAAPGPVTVMPFSQKIVGNPVLPAIHGGVTGALLESAAIFAMLAELQVPALPRTINITIDYLRSGRPQDTRAVGMVTRLGRRVASVHAEAWQDDRRRPIATALAHFLVVPEEG